MPGFQGHGSVVAPLVHGFVPRRIRHLCGMPKMQIATRASVQRSIARMFEWRSIPRAGHTRGIGGRSAGSQTIRVPTARLAAA